MTEEELNRLEAACEIAFHALSALPKPKGN